MYFSLFKGELFAIFTLQGWNLCNFYLHEIFFWWKGQKNYSCNGEFFEILVFILVVGVFLSGILGVCCFYTNHPFFGVLCWHFLSFKRVFLTIFTFWGFFAMKMDKTFSFNGECFKILIFVSVIWVILSGILRGCFFFYTIDPFSFVWFVDIFHPLRVNCLKLSPSWDFILVKMDKKLL